MTVSRVSLVLFFSGDLTAAPRGSHKDCRVWTKGDLSALPPLQCVLICVGVCSYFLPNPTLSHSHVYDPRFCPAPLLSPGAHRQGASGVPKLPAHVRGCPFHW